MKDSYDITDFYPELLEKAKIKPNFYPEPRRKPLHERIAAFTGESIRELKYENEVNND